MVSRRKHNVKRRVRTRKAGQVRQSLLNDIVRLKPVKLPPGQTPVITKADYGLISEHHDVVPDVPPSYPTLSVSSQEDTLRTPEPSPLPAPPTLSISSQEDTVRTPEPSPLPAPRRRVKVFRASRKVVPAGRRRGRGRRYTRKV
jgi:hypothetical protein